MGIVTGKQNVLDIYREAGEKKWVLPCFCTENLTTTEAILGAAKEYGRKIGIEDLPIIIAITCKYSHRSQASFYTHTRRWDIGLQLFYKDIEILTAKGSPYENLRVLVHLDHIQYDEDIELLNSDLSKFSSIMYDASRLSYEKNIEYTRQFVQLRGKELVIEGACDEIIDAEGEETSELTTPQKAKKYYVETGVDLIVANLGTEHRASSQNLMYHDDAAKRIKEYIGNHIVLHGASSVPSSQIKGLFEDGVCKVNIWTTLERDSVPELFKSMVKNSSKVAGTKLACQMKEDGFLGENSLLDQKASIDYFTTVYRQDIVFEEMKKIILVYLDLYYR